MRVATSVLVTKSIAIFVALLLAFTAPPTVLADNHISQAGWITYAGYDHDYSHDDDKDHDKKLYCYIDDKKHHDYKKLYCIVDHDDNNHDDHDDKKLFCELVDHHDKKHDHDKKKHHDDHDDKKK